MHILLSSEETLYQVSTKYMGIRGRAERHSAQLFFKLRNSLPEKQALEQSGYITIAAQAAFASLNKLDWLKRQFGAEVNLTPNIETTISFERDSSSAGLGYALALALEWRKQLNKTIDYDVEVFATGEIHSSGAVTEIGHLDDKITAACNFMEKKNIAAHKAEMDLTGAQNTETQVKHPFVIFYPIANQEDVTPELQRRVAELGGKLCPVERLQSALTILLGDAYDGDAEGRWEPFKGLLSFNYEDSLRFFGRERALTKLNNEFNEAEGLVVCTGVSGSGKSSLIKAGLIPQINQDMPEGNALDWLISTPKAHSSVESMLVELLHTLDKHWSIGTNSKDNSDKDQSEEGKNSDLEALSKEAIQSPGSFIATIQQAQLLQPTKRIFYYIDQFEDIFNHQDISREQAQQLAPLLAQLAKQIHNLDIVISIRSEYEYILGKYGSVSHVNPELNASEWRDIVYKQATSFGLRYEPELEKRISNEAASIEHALPALEYLLEQLYNKAKKADKNSRLLTHEHYEQLNGIRGVIAARAEEVIAKHPMQAHAFFEYFVGLNNENKPYGKSVNTDEAKQDSEALYDLIQTFIDAQLVVDCSTETEKRVKLAHDTLFNFDNHDSVWAALKDWFEESQEYLQWFNVIFGDFKRWQVVSHRKFDENSIDEKINSLCLSSFDLKQAENFQERGIFNRKTVRQYIKFSRDLHNYKLNQKLIAETKAKDEANNNLALALNERVISSINSNKIEEAKLLALHACNKSYKNYLPFDSLSSLQRYGCESSLMYRGTLKSEPISLAFSPIHQLIAFGFEDGLIKIVNISNNESIKLKGHTWWVTGLMFSSCGKYLVSCSYDKSVRYWDIELRTSKIFKGHQELIFNVYLGDDDKTIVSGDSENSIYLWDIKEGLVDSFKSINGEFIDCVLLTADCSTIIFSSSGKHDFYLMNIQTKNITSCTGHKGSVTDLLFNSFNHNIISCSLDKTIKIWSIEGKLLNTLALGESSPSSLFLTSQGSAIGAISKNSDVAICDVELDFVEQYPIKSTRATTWFDPHTALSVGDECLNIWDVTRQVDRSRYRKHVDGIVNCIKYSSCGKYLVYGTSDRHVYFWDVGSGQEKRILTVEHEVSSLAFANEKNLIAIGSWDKSITFYDFDTMETTQVIKCKGDIQNVCFSHDDTYIFINISGVSFGTFLFYEFEADIYLELGGSDNKTTCISSSNKSNQLVSGTMDGSIHLWDSEHTESELFTGHTEQVICVCLSPDDKYICSASYDKTLCLWDIKSKKPTVLTAHTDKLICLLYSPNGKYIVSSARDNLIIIWEVKTRKYVNKILCPSWVVSLDFSADSNNLALSLRDGTIRVWDFNLCLQIQGKWDVLIDKFESQSGLNVNILSVGHATDESIENISFSAPLHSASYWNFNFKGEQSLSLIQLGIIAQKNNEWNKAQKLFEDAELKGNVDALYYQKINSFMQEGLNNSKSKEPEKTTPFWL